MKEILLIGGGGHCRACIDVIEKIESFKIVGIIDNHLSEGEVCGYPILGSDEQLSKLVSKVKSAFVTVGQLESSIVRRNIFVNLLKLGYKIPVFVSPLAYVAKGVKIGQGTIIMHNALVNREASLGENNIINTKALIEHDVKVQNHCHISTNAVVNGGAVVENDSFIGSGSVVIQGAVVPEGSFVKATQIFK